MDDIDKNAAEEYNKQLLKQTAVTFSLEGTSKDLKYFIQKKVSHNKTNLVYLTQLMDLTINSETDEVIEQAFKKGGPLKGLLEHIYSEIVKTDALLNKAIDLTFEKEINLKGSKK